MSISSSPSTAPAMRGRLAVLAMLAIAGLAASFAWWWNYTSGRRALEFYGPEAATLIRTAPRVELVPANPADTIDISRSPGLLNARTSLLSDASFEWERPGVLNSAALDIVRFTDGDRSIDVAFDFETHAIRTSAGRRATLTSRTSEGWKAYLQRQNKGNTDRH